MGKVNFETGCQELLLKLMKGKGSKKLQNLENTILKYGDNKTISIWQERIKNAVTREMKNSNKIKTTTIIKLSDLNKMQNKLKNLNGRYAIVSIASLAIGSVLTYLLMDKKSTEVKNTHSSTETIINTNPENITQTSTKPETKYHIVENGDNIWKIAKTNLHNQATQSDILNYTNRLLDINELEATDYIYAKDTVFLN